MSESRKAAIDRIETRPLETQKRCEQDREKRFLRVELQEKLKDAEAALQNHLLNGLERKQRAIRHVDIMDEMIEASYPGFKKYLSSSPEEETNISNEACDASRDKEGGLKFRPKTIGETMKLRAEIMETFGNIIEKRENILSKAIEMPETITININLNSPALPDGDEAQVVDGDYDPQADFKDI